MRDKDIQIIQAIIQKYIDPEENKVFIFGSRANGDHRKFSDYDIGIEGKELDAETYFSIVQDLEDSDLEYTADVVDFNNVSDNFKKTSESHRIPLNY